MANESAAKFTPVIERQHPAGLGGTQVVYRFANGYGASVVQFPHSYGYAEGLYELAVIHFDGENNDAWRLTYDTPVTSDVLGYLSEEEVLATLVQIAALEAA